MGGRGVRPTSEVLKMKLKIGVRMMQSFSYKCHMNQQPLFKFSYKAPSSCFGGGLLDFQIFKIQTSKLVSVR